MARSDFWASKKEHTVEMMLAMERYSPEMVQEMADDMPHWLVNCDIPDVMFGLAKAEDQEPRDSRTDADLAHVRFSQQEMAERNRAHANQLNAAAEQGKCEVIDVLLQKGADVTARDADGWTALHWAAHAGHSEVVGMLLQRGADLSAETKTKRSALHLAAAGSHLSILDTLLEKGAEPNAKDKWGDTALHLAVRKGCLDIAGFLLKRGAEVDSQTVVGNTGLHMAAAKGNAEMAELLLRRGADVGVRNYQDGGHTPARFARGKVVEILREAEEKLQG